MSLQNHKKPKSGSSRYHRKHKWGNVTSSSCSRPGFIHETFHKPRRIVEKGTINEVTRLQNLDFEVVSRLDGKTGRRRFSENHTEKTVTNPQSHQNSVSISKRDKFEYCINLHQIYPKLFLSNYHYAKTIEDNTYDIIINLCGKKLCKNDGVKIHYVTMSDFRYIPYRTFADIVNRCVEIIGEAVQNNYSILIHCAKGVNRSVSIILGYCILKLNYSLQDGIRYIENKKISSGFPHWDTLTNQTFVRLLECINSKIEK